MKTMKKILSLVMVVAMLMAVCSVGVFAADPTYTLNVTGADTVARGASVQLQTTLYKTDENGSMTPVQNATFTWSSSDRSIATVDSTGNVTGVGKGTVTITAQYIGAEGTAPITGTKNITVKGGDPESIKIEGITTIKPNGTTNLSIKQYPADSTGTATDVTWTSSNNIVTVTQDTSDPTKATVTAGATTGDAMITAAATYNGVTETAYIEVKVKESYTITFNAVGGTGTMEPKTVEAGKPVQIVNTFTKNGYIFAGWNTKADGTGDVYPTSFTPDKDLLLYAQWKFNDNVNFSVNVDAGKSVELTAAQILGNNKALTDTTGFNKIELTYSAGTKGTLKIKNAAYSASNNVLDTKTAKLAYTAKSTSADTTDIITYKATLGTIVYNGTITVNIKSATKNIAKTASASLPATITPADFAETGKTLRSVTITGGTPTSIYGTLTNTYGNIGLGNAVVLNYAYTTPYFTYTPSTTYVNAGTVTFTYTAAYTDGSTVTGTITITITSGGKVINYTATATAPATFNANDFTYYALTGQYNNNYTLSQVSFDMSSKLAYYYGTLTNAYYSNWGTAAGLKTTTGAYVGATRFTPSVSATNGMTVEIPFTAYYTGTYGAAAQTVSGTVRITIGNGGTVNVTTAAGTPYTFKGTEFDQAGATLSTIQFTSLPTALQGGLYYNYNAATKTGTPVTTADIFSRTGTTTYPYNYKALLGLTFVPGAYATNGTQITIPFSATYSNSVVPTTGTLVITIGTNNTVNITTNVNTPYTFKGTEFDQTGATLSYVQFTSLPTTLQGGLYYNYNAATKTGTAVTTADVFYKTAIGGMYNSKILSGLTFVPSTYATNGTTITIPFTAYYSNSLTPVTGNLVITIGTGTASVKITYSPAAGSTSVTFNAADFQAACTKALGSTSVLQSVRFQLPTHNTLYYKANTTTAAQTVKATDVFNYSAYGTPAGLNLAGVYLSYQGFAPTSITYVGTDTTGRTFTGTVVVAPKTYFDNAKVTYKTGMYKDVTESKWYGTQQQGTIKSIVQMGLMKGYETGNFMPEGNITLAEAVAMAARLNSIYNGGTGTFTQASGSKWYQVYVDYCVSKGIIKSNDFTNYNAKATRAQMAYIFANAVPSYELVAINSVTVPDVKTTDSYGTYIYRLYNAGVLTGYKNTAGYKNGAFAPTTNITRAEVATIVSRIALPSTRVSQSF